MKGECIRYFSHEKGKNNMTVVAHVQNREEAECLKKELRKVARKMNHLTENQFGFEIFIQM